MSIGSALKEERAKRKLSIADIAAEIKINKKYIQALEEGNYLLIPSQVYAKGFLKAYSEFLGLDPKALVGELTNYYKNVEEAKKTTSAAPKLTKIIPLPKELKLPKMPAIPKYEFNAKMMFAALVSVFFIILIISVYGYMLSYQKSTIQVKANPPAPAKIEAAKILPKAVPAVASAAVPEGKIELRIEATKRSHIAVSSGSMELYSGTLQPGAKLRFVGKEITVKAGNGGGIKVSVNGAPLGLMGEEGVVAEKTYKASQ